MSAAADTRAISGEALGSDLALDFDFDGAAVQAALVEQIDVPEPSDPWLARRDAGWGCSDLPALMLALGKRDATTAPKGLTTRVALRRTRRGIVPRIFAEKARLLRPLKSGAPAHEGKVREKALFDQWRSDLVNGIHASPSDRYIDPHSIQHVSEAVPLEWLPLVDRVEPHLLDTPDGFGRLYCGCLVAIQAKCSFGEKSEITWPWRDQLNGEIAVTGSQFGVLLCGVGWSHWNANIQAQGVIRSFWLERDETAIAELREAARAGWTRVEALAG